jgi:predicted transcriptional regulator
MKLFEAGAREEMTMVTFRADEDVVEQVDELAAEAGVSRSEVIREALKIGMGSLMGEWERAQANAKGGKKDAVAKR